MKKAFDKIQQIHYEGYIYDNKKEERKHHIEMSEKGFIKGDFFYNLPDNEITYSKTILIKNDNYIPREPKNDEKFYFLFKRGYLEAKDIAICIENYYKYKSTMTLYDYLGMTKEQCKQWITEGIIK